MASSRATKLICRNIYNLVVYVYAHALKCYNSVSLHGIILLAEKRRTNEQAIKKGSSSFLTHIFFGILTQIKCSIFSYQFNILYLDHMLTLILNFLWVPNMIACSCRVVSCHTNTHDGLMDICGVFRSRD